MRKKRQWKTINKDKYKNLSNITQNRGINQDIIDNVERIDEESEWFKRNLIDSVLNTLPNQKYGKKTKKDMIL